MFTLLALPGCSDKKIDFVKQYQLEKVFKQGGWEFNNYQIDPLVTIENWLKARSKAIFKEDVSLVWKREKSLTPSFFVITAMAKKSADALKYTFIVDTSGKGELVSLVKADVSAKWKYIQKSATVDNSFSSLTRVSIVDRLSNGEAHFRFEGCFVYNGKEPISKLHLRASMLALSKDQKYSSYRGKAKHHTRRSGIPDTLQNGDYFCTVLKSSKMEKSVAKGEFSKVFGVVEASWLDSNGQIRFSPLANIKLNWGTYSGKMPDLFALVKGGPLKKKKKEAEISMLANPSLVTILERRGSRYWVRTASGKQGFLDNKNVIAVYPRKPAFTPNKDIKKLIKQFVGMSVSGKVDDALQLFSKNSKSLQGEKLKADVLRRFPVESNKKFETLNLQILDTQNAEGFIMVSYFVWLKNGAEIVWQSFDTIFVEQLQGGNKLLALDI